jgi:peptidoglycan hydrolase CwlO-like protein
METSTGKTTADMLYEKSMANYVEALKARVEHITTGIKHYQEDIDTINKRIANYVEALKARVEHITTGIKHYQEDIDTINKRIAIDQQQIDITNQRIKEAEEKLK